MRGLLRTMLAALAVIGFCATPALAGNIALTGHDDDFHCPGDGIASGACQQLKSLVTFARAGSSLPVLVFDQGSELTNSLTLLGISFTEVNPSTASNVTDALFNTATFSAFIEASDNSCGGCDNNSTGEANINAHATAIANFFNAGGGIVGLAGAEANGTYYNFLPQSAGIGVTTDSVNGFLVTGSGCTTTGFVAVNGDETHNYFPQPGAGGLSSAYCVAETGPDLNPAGQREAVTLLLSGGSIVTSGITTGSTAPVPEPATLTLVGIGLAAAYRRRQRRS